MEYVDRPSPPSPALYLQCYSLFAVESRSEKKKRKRGWRKDKKQKE